MIFGKTRECSLFEVHRLEDTKGISGVGHVLDGVVFPDGTTVIRWKSKNSSTAVFKSYKQFEKIHLAHHGKSEIRWISGFEGVEFALDIFRQAQVIIGTDCNKAPVSQKFAYQKVKDIVSGRIAELEGILNDGGKISATFDRGQSQGSLQSTHSGAITVTSSQ